jgi:hypothetical protein
MALTSVAGSEGFKLQLKQSLGSSYAAERLRAKP